MCVCVCLKKILPFLSTVIQQCWCVWSSCVCNHGLHLIAFGQKNVIFPFLTNHKIISLSHENAVLACLPYRCWATSLQSVFKNENWDSAKSVLSLGKRAWESKTFSIELCPTYSCTQSHWITAYLRIITTPLRIINQLCVYLCCDLSKSLA